MQKYEKYLERLVLNGNSRAVFSQLAAIQIDLISVKTHNRIGTVSDQRKPRLVVSDFTPTHYKGRTTQFTSIANAHIPLLFLQFTNNSPAVH